MLPKFKFKPISDIKSIRKKLFGMNQFEFWNLVGVTQSGGSRYENGRAIPNGTLELLAQVIAARKAELAEEKKEKKKTTKK